MVQEDQLSLAIGRRGQNVRLASKLVGWDIEIMTHDELASGIERAEGWFRQLPNVTDEIVEKFIEEGFLSYDDLTFLEPGQLAELSNVSDQQADEMIHFAEGAAERVEVETRAAKALAAETESAAPTHRQGSSRSSTPTAADLFPEPLPSAADEDKITAEQLFGPDSDIVVHEEPAAQTEPDIVSEAEKESPAPSPPEGEAGV